MHLKILPRAAALVLLLPLGACSGCSSLTAATAAVTSDKPIAGATLLDEKVLYAAEATLYGADTAADAAIDAGLLDPGSPQAITIADGLATAHGALTAARAAYRVGDATTFAARAAAARDAATAAWALIPKKD